MDAIEDLKRFLNEGETVEGIVFGEWGWSDENWDEDKEWKAGYGEPSNIPVPFDMRGKLLTLEQAKQYMTGWRFYSGNGAPLSYATYIWTDQRVIWVTESSGATCLDSAPRSPVAVMPYMSGW